MGWFRTGKKNKTEQPDKEELWAVCPSCKAHIFREEWLNAQNICPACNFHDKITCHERLELLIDKDTFSELSADVSTSDPLKFEDVRGKYAERAEATKEKVGLNESIHTGHGKIHGMAVAIGVMDFRFMGGSLGSGTGEKILRLTSYALRHKMPCIVISASIRTSIPSMTASRELITTFASSRSSEIT